MKKTNATSRTSPKSSDYKKGYADAVKEMKRIDDTNIRKFDAKKVGKTVRNTKTEYDKGFSSAVKAKFGSGGHNARSFPIKGKEK